MKKIFINLSLSLISILLVLSAGEIFLRVFNIYQPGREKLLTVYDPLLGWKLKPGSRGHHKTEEYSVTEVINSKGLRGPEIPYEKPEGLFRVVLLGDSFVEGYMVDFEKHFSQVIKKELQSRKLNVEVICVGVAGYSTDQELLLYENEGKKYHPDVTVLMFCDNDVWYNVQPNYWRGYKPLFKLHNGELITTNVPVPKPMVDQKPRNNWTKMKNIIINNSALYNYVENKLKDFSSSNVFGQKIPVKSNQAQCVLPEEFKFFSKNYTPDMHYAWKVTEAIIIRLKKVVQADNARFLVCYIPNSCSIYRHQWEDTKKKYKILDEDSNVEQIGLELGMICQRNAIDYLNLTNPLHEEAIKLEPLGERLYYLRNGHWNDLGNKIAGNYLANYIRSNFIRH